jgi:hypothetical protein
VWSFVLTPTVLPVPIALVLPIHNSLDEKISQRTGLSLSSSAPFWNQFFGGLEKISAA